MLSAPSGAYFRYKFMILHKKDGFSWFFVAVLWFLSDKLWHTSFNSCLFNKKIRLRINISSLSYILEQETTNLDALGHSTLLIRSNFIVSWSVHYSNFAILLFHLLCNRWRSFYLSNLFFSLYFDNSLYHDTHIFLNHCCLCIIVRFISAQFI